LKRAISPSFHLEAMEFKVLSPKAAGGYSVALNFHFDLSIFAVELGLRKCLHLLIKSIKMNVDSDKIDSDILALLYLTAFRQKKDYPWQAWKGLDWDALARLHEKGFIQDPKNKNKSITFTDEGIDQAKRLFESKYHKS